MSDLRCSFCARGEPDVELVLARRGAVICSDCTDTAHRILTALPNPYDRIHGGMIEAVAIAEGGAKPARLHVVHVGRPA